VSVWVGWGRGRVGSLGMCGGTGQCVYGGVYETTGRCQCVCMGGRGRRGRITRLILLVNHRGLSFLTVITLLGMLVFAASIKARVMLLVDISISSLTSKESQSTRDNCYSIKEQKGQTYQVIGNDSVLPEISVIT
jgi:hypothetical protein